MSVIKIDKYLNSFFKLKLQDADKELYNSKSTRLSRQHNNANIIALGARLTKKSLSLKLVDLFLKTKFEGGRHIKRVKKI